MQINRGDIYWLRMLGEIPHPHVVISDNELNHSDIDTVVVCALTTNRKKITMPGNVLLHIGEGNLEKQSIVDVANILTVEKSKLGEYLGTLSELRVTEILAGIRFLQYFFMNR